MSLFRRVIRREAPRPYRLTVDGKVRGYFASSAEAVAAAGNDYSSYFVHENVHGRWFAGGFGYKTGAGMSTAEMARRGVPIAPQCISGEEL